MSERQRNDGLRKRCDCARRTWAKCPHPWHFNFKWLGEVYRFSLERHVGRIVRGADGKWERDRSTLGKPITDKTTAETERDRLRTAIRDGTLQQAPADRPQRDTLTLGQLLDTYRKQYISVHRAGTLRNTEAQIGKILRTSLDRQDGTARAFGEWLVLDITTDVVEQYRHARMETAPIGANRDLALLRALFNWATSSKRKLASENPFMDGAAAAVKLTRETKRSRRLHAGESERLLSACGSHLRAVVEAALETGCRLGELLSLQWHQVRAEPRPELFLPSGKTKTKQDRRVPVSTRLQGILAMRRTGPDGLPHRPDAYVFGNQVGERVKRISRAWERAVLVAHGQPPSTPRRAPAGCQRPPGGRSEASTCTFMICGGRPARAGWTAACRCTASSNGSGTRTLRRPRRTSKPTRLTTMRPCGNSKRAGPVCNRVQRIPKQGHKPGFLGI